MTTTVRFEVRGAVRDLFTTRDELVCISGPAGSGKSRGALFWLHMMVLKYPGTRALLIRKTHTSLTATTLTTFKEKVLGEALSDGLVHFYGGSGSEPASFRYSNGSRVVVGGLDRSEKVMSSDYSIIVCDEAIELTASDVDVLRTRLRGGAPGTYPAYRLVLLTNPGPPTHHLNTRPEVRMAYSVHEDNPELFADAAWTTEGERYLASLEKLSGPRYHRLRHGRWSAAEGIVFDGFDPAVHIVEPFDIPAHWPRTLAVDFGFVHGFAALWLARDDDGRLYVYRELLHTGRLVEDHAAQMLACMSGEPWPRSIVCDHQAEDRATLERHLGAGTRPAKKTVSDGIQAVASRLKPAGDGRPRLFFMRGALVERDPALAEAGKPTCITEEIGGYVWNDHKNKDEPVKENDDLVDTLRYGIAEHDLKPRPRVRFM